MKAGAVLAAAGTVAALAFTSVPAAAIQAGRPAGARSQLDVRANGAHTPVPADVRGARHRLALRLGIEAHVATDPVGGGIRVLNRTDGFLSGPHAGDPADVALAYVRAHADVFGVSEADLDALRLVHRSTSNGGVTHLTWVPQSAGVPAYDSELRVHVARDGSVVAASGPPLGGLSIGSATPQLTAAQALAVAQDDVGAPVTLPRAATRAGVQRVTTFSNGDRASLVAFDAPHGDRLAWRVTVAGQDPYWFEEVVDAGSGAVLARRSLTDFAVSNASVFDYHPGAAPGTADGGTAHTVDIARWLGASATTLTGPNAHAYADPGDDGETDGTPVEIPPRSGTDWTYPQQAVLPAGGQSCSSFSGICTWDGVDTATELTNRAQATTQVFYYVNTFHDWLAGAGVGFATAGGPTSGGNFQDDDPVLAEADDGGGFDNANMTTFPDGISPKMQMYLFKAFPGLPWPAVNGADDASIVYHEYTHGLSNRLIDDAQGLNQNQGQAMGEGWSDWYAMDYLVDHGFVSDTGSDGQVIVGEYATGDRAAGIRTQPLDCAVGSSAPACPGTTTAGSGGYTFADLGRVGAYNAATPRFEVHDDGEIWSETLWDLRTALGGATTRRLVTEAMRMSPADPTFLDERDAILLADETLDAGADHDTIWQVFAARGMGYAAFTVSPNATRGVAFFEPPSVTEVASTTVTDPAPGGDADGVPEPGELLGLTVRLTNPGERVLTDVQATLTTSTPGVELPTAVAAYGTIGLGDSADGAAPFAVRLPSAMTCGAQAALTLHVTSDQGAVDLPVAISTGSGSDTFASSDVPKTIVDGDRASVSAVSALTIPGGGRVDHLRVTLGVTHSFVGDLHGFLTSPAGTTMVLLERPGSGQFGSDLVWDGDVTFDDAFDSIQEIPFGAFPGDALAGPYAPDEPFAAFAGEDRAGTWTLRLVDVIRPDGGTLSDWSIETDQPACTPPPGGGGGGGGPGGGGAGGSGSGAGGAGGSGSGGGGAGGSGSGGGSGVVRSLSGLTTKATLSAHHAFAFAFLATPGLKGTVRFTIPKHGRAKAIAFGRRSFTVPRSGRVRLTTTVGGRALAQLRTRHTTSVTVTIVLGGTPFTKTLKLTAPPPRRRHRR